MHMVYWTVQDGNGYQTPHSELFHSTEMREAMTKMEELRKFQYEGVQGYKVMFITMSSEDPNSVGKLGVDVVGKDYSWTKRRTTKMKKDLT